MQYTSQIQENWSDVTAKTKTIIDFQQSVAELSLSETDKNKFFSRRAPPVQSESTRRHNSLGIVMGCKGCCAKKFCDNNEN